MTNANRSGGVECYDAQKVLQQAREMNAYVHDRRKRGDVINLRELSGPEGSVTCTRFTKPDPVQSLDVLLFAQQIPNEKENENDGN